MAITGSTEKREGPIRLGMVGGGKDAFIGAVHRIAARLDGEFMLVAGALSSTPERALESGRALGLDEKRIYGSFRDMAAREARRKDGIEAVAIVTPNHMHYPVAKEFLRRGIHVICDKPLTSTLADARKLAALARESDALFVLTHNYTGYPMTRQARQMVAEGALGTIRVVQAEYAQDWLTEAAEETGSKQASWRTDPARSGAGGSIGDIGTHAYHLAGFVTGLTLESLTADLATFVGGRALDDNAHVMMRYQGGARGLLWSSQVAIGNSNGVRLRVFGEKGSLQWFQEQPNELVFTPLDGRVQIIKRGADDLSEDARLRIRTPPGHPEGYLEAFANLYAGFAEAIRARQEGREPNLLGQNLPLVYDGLKGVAFVEAVVDSHEAEGQPWLTPVAV